MTFKEGFPVKGGKQFSRHFNLFPELLQKVGWHMFGQLRVVESPGFRRRMEELGGAPVVDSPESMARRIREETEKFAVMVKQANVVLE